MHCLRLFLAKKHNTKKERFMNKQLSKKQGITKVGIPNMGVYGRFWKRVIEDSLTKIGVTNIKLELAPPTTKKTVNRGSQHMDENMCLPAKIILGNILELSESGCDIILEWDNCGECRQKTYCLVHQSTLRQLGVSSEIVSVRPGNMTEWLLKIAPNLSKREQRKIVRELLRELWKLDLQFMKKQADPPKDKPKIGICGEIYTVLEPAANLGLIARLEEQGAYVHNALPLSQFVFEDLLNGENRVSWAAKFAYLEMFTEIKDWCLKRTQRPDVDYDLFKKAEKATEKYFP